MTEIQSILNQLSKINPNPSDKHQCIARVWKNKAGKGGYGSQCGRPITNGDFCGLHGKLKKTPKPCREPKCPNYGKIEKYTWEHCGRYDKPCPHFFNPSVWKTCTSLIYDLYDKKTFLDRWKERAIQYPKLEDDFPQYIEQLEFIVGQSNNDLKDALQNIETYKKYMEDNFNDNRIELKHFKFMEECIKEYYKSNISEMN